MTSQEVLVLSVLNTDLRGQPLQKRIKGLAEACYRFTPKVTFGEKGMLFLEIGQTRHLFDRSKLLQKIQVLVRRFDLRVQWGWGETAEMALGALRYPGLSSDQWSLEVLPDLLSPFAGDDVSRRKVFHLILLFKKMKIRNLGDLRALSREDLVSRFGHFGERVFSKIHGMAADLWPLWAPPVQISEEQSVEGISLQHGSIEALLFPMRAALDRLRSRLYAREQRLSKVELTFFLEAAQGRASYRQWLFEFHFVQSSSLNVLAIVRERLSRDLETKPLEDPVVHFVFKVIEAHRASHGQRDLLSSYEENAESWNHLTVRLIEKLGEGNVFQTKSKEAYRPEQAWERKLEGWKDHRRVEFAVREQNWDAYQKALDVSFRSVLHELQRRTKALEMTTVVDRPTRLLREPLLLRFRNASLSLDDVRYQKSWAVDRWEGPERLKTLWWESEALERDYFVVTALEGERLWIFQEKGQFYLHGFFD